MTPTQKAAMQAALRLAESIARPTSRGSWNPTTIQLREHCDALRNALAEPVAGLEQPAVTDEIVLAACQKIAPTLFTRGLTPLDTDGPNWRQRMSDVENTVRVVLSFAAPQPQQPAEVPLLTQAEINEIDTSEFWDDHTPQDFARAIEALVRQKAELV